MNLLKITKIVLASGLLIIATTKFAVAHDHNYGHNNGWKHKKNYQHQSCNHKHNYKKYTRYIHNNAYNRNYAYNQPVAIIPNRQPHYGNQNQGRIGVLFETGF